jgi:uncharacterized protein
MTTAQMLISLVIGCFSGVVAALCGVGGGVVMVPCFIAFLALDQKSAVATSLMAMIGTAIATSIQNHRNGLLENWNLALVTTVGAVITSTIAAGYLKSLSNERLTQIFGTLLVVVGVRMLWMGRV